MRQETLHRHSVEAGGAGLANLARLPPGDCGVGMAGEPAACDAELQRGRLSEIAAQADAPHARIGC